MSSGRVSVVIPAHDEETVIERCLTAFLPWTGPGEVQVLVVANGCTDATATRARAVPGVGVLELAQGSKRAALNAGDSGVDGFPRIYLDADITLPGPVLHALVRTLDTDRPIAAAPAPHFVLDGRPWAVRAFYRAYTALPYVAEGLIGLGVVGLSATGRARFGEFPDAIADDLFVQRLFRADERVVLAEHRFDLQTPRTLRSLVTVRTRTARGSSQLAGTAPGHADFSRTTGATVRALGALVLRDPRLLPAAVVYTAVVLVARRRARRAGDAWQRDSTTR